MHLDWGIVDSKLLATGTAEELKNSLKSVLPSIATVYLVGENQSFLEVVRAQSNEFECECGTWKDGVQSRIDTASMGVRKSVKTQRICVVFGATTISSVTATETALLLRSIVNGQHNDEVPFERLYSLYFSHVQHESNWVNSRFMWFMFANSALIALFAKLDVWVFSLIASIGGLYVSLLTLWLTEAAFSAEQRVINQCVAIAKDWKRAVPQTAKYILDTPCGGNSEETHRSAQRWMRRLVYTFIAIWSILILLVGLQVIIDITSWFQHLPSIQPFDENPN